LNFWRIFISLLLFSLPLSGEDTSTQKRPVTRTDACTEGGCHADATKYPVLHAPLNAGGCSGCHDYADPLKHTFRLTRQGNDLCLFCHTIESGAYSHKPLTEKGCLECHNPHGGETKTHLRAKTVRTLCDQCHKDVVKGKREHEPIATGGCLACHAPHRSDYRNLLHQKPNRVCLDCHVVFADRIKQASVVHKPVGEDCLQCHDAHASDRSKLLKDPVRELCFSCHEDIRLTVENAQTPHGALTEIGECMNCHDAHASGQPHLLKNVTRTLCLKCHDKEIRTPSGKIPDMTGILGTGNTLHGPITINNCTECHQIHGGARPRLLNKEFPPSFYSSFTEDNYELCFSCHDPSLALIPRTTSLTGFRDGDRNLHFVHVNQKTKGLTCRACHEIHAGNSEKQISNSVPFGDWRIPTGFSRTATGGSCSPGCHKTYSYDRQRPAQDNPSPANPPETESVDGGEGK
jgi:predicted CXXCH cytochrome family protein